MRRTFALVVVGAVVALATLLGPLVYPAVHQAASSAAHTVSDVARGTAAGDGDASGPDGDGALPEGVSVFDDQHAGVLNLDPRLLQAVRDAAADASEDGIVFYVNSGWRSADYQNQLLREAIAEYGSEEEAARWVATADTSLHVSGEAVDIGHADAESWLSEHGGEYGLCQIYRNEPWHYELRPAAVDRGCPPMYADPTHDPRLQR